MAEKKVSVRLAAVGGKELKGEFVAIGAAAKDALSGIGANSNAAESGLSSVEASAERARRAFEELSIKAANSAASMRTTAAAASPMVDQINRLTGVTPVIGQTTAEYLQQGQALDHLRAKYNPVYAAIQRYRNAVSEVKSAHLQGAISAQEMTAAIQRERKAALGSIAALKGRTTAIMGMSRATGVARARSQQLFFQLNDIGVSLAGGMNPLLVMAQQGTQISQIYGFGNGGVGGAFRDLQGMIGGLARRFWPVAAAIGAVSAVVGGLTREINNTTDSTVTFGDTAKAIWQTVVGGLDTLLRPAIEKISDWFWTAWDWAVDATVSAVNSIINNAKILVLGIKTAINVVPSHFEAMMGRAKAYVFWGLNDIVGGFAKMLESVTNGLNSVFNLDLSGPTGIFEVAGKLNAKGNDAFEASNAAAKTATAAWGAFGAKAQQIADENPMGELFDTIRNRAIQNSLDRVVEGMDNVGGAARRAGEAAKESMNAAKKALADYAAEAKDTGKGIGQVLTDGFRSAESAFRKFAEGGKFEFRGLVQSIIADLAVLQFRSGLGSVAEFLGNSIGSGGGVLGGLFGSIMHDGGTVGFGGPKRAVPALAFAGAERFHDGGWPGLRPNEVPVIAERGERIWSRREVAQGMANSRQAGGAVDVRIMMEGGNLVPVIERVSGRVAARVTAAGMNTVQRGFGRTLDDHVAREG